MPGPPVVRGAALQRALAAKKVTIESIDACARNVGLYRVSMNVKY